MKEEKVMVYACMHGCIWLYIVIINPCTCAGGLL